METRCHVEINPRIRRTLEGVIVGTIAQTSQRYGHVGRAVREG